MIVGGTGVGSTDVERQGRALAPTVSRVSGEDRYETSRRVVERFFPGAEPTVYLATGRDLPDALSGGALAARMGAPVLLVDGIKQSVDSSTRRVLERLSAGKVVVFGDTGVVSSKLLSSAAAVTSASAARLGGSNRYETSTRIAAAASGDGEVLMVTGLDFPDALSAIQLAAVRNAPIVLTVPYCVGGSTAPAVSSAARLTLIGGPGGRARSRRLQDEMPSDAHREQSLGDGEQGDPAPPPVLCPGGAAHRGRHGRTGAHRGGDGARTHDRRGQEQGGRLNQTGWAMDVVACTSSYYSGIDHFGGSAQGRWTVKNAHRFGFVVRYEPGRTRVTGYASEPWHLRYVGVPLASDYKKGGFHTLEEYLAYPPAPSY